MITVRSWLFASKHSLYVILKNTRRVKLYIGLTVFARSGLGNLAFLHYFSKHVKKDYKLHVPLLFNDIPSQAWASICVWGWEGRGSRAPVGHLFHFPFNTADIFL